MNGSSNKCMHGIGWATLLQAEFLILVTTVVIYHTILDSNPILFYWGAVIK